MSRITNGIRRVGDIEFKMSSICRLSSVASAFIPKIAILPFTEEKISARAYSIFLREGSVDGSERNRFRAIKELLAETEIKVDESPDTPPMPTGRMPSRDT